MKSQIVQCKSTSLLIQNVKEELSNAGYKPRTIQVYQRHWDHLLKYEAQKGITFYSPKIGLEFLNVVYGISVFTDLSKLDKVPGYSRSLRILKKYISKQ